MTEREVLMGKADLTEKILEDYNDVFADIVNVLLFKGEERVIPDLLTNSYIPNTRISEISCMNRKEMF